MSKENTKAITGFVKNVRTALEKKGYLIGQSHMLQAVTAALGETNWAVLRAKLTGTAASKSAAVGQTGTVLIRTADSALFSGKELQALGWKVDCVVPVGMDWFEDIEYMNDQVSEMLTGSIGGLVGIGYEAYPHFYDKDNFALRVTAQVSDEHVQELLEELDEQQLSEDGADLD